MEKIFLPAERYPTPTVTALGFFDGVHLAHAALLRQTVEMAKQKGCRPAVFTFLDAPHKEGKKLFSKQKSFFCVHPIEESIYESHFVKRQYPH